MQLRRLERCNNQQHAVCSHRTRGGNLIAVDDKVFADYRQPAGAARSNKIIVVALEVIAIGKH